MLKRRRFCSFFAILTILVYIFAIPTAAVEPPSEILEASSAILLNIETESVAYEHSPDLELMPSASAKLMTAYLAYGQLKDRLDERVTISEDMVEGYKNYQSFHTGEWKSLYDYIGKRIEVSDLFELLLISGSNDAAKALAVLSFGGESEFVSKMNEKAKELKMSSTVYKNTTGINLMGAKTTARDAAKLACAFYGNAFLVNISSAFMSKITVGSDEVTIYNRNPIASNYYERGYYDTEVTGIIYGASSRTDACLITEKTAGNLSYIAVIMGADRDSALLDSEGNKKNAFTLSSALLEYGTKEFALKCVLEKHEIFASLPVKMSRQADFVTLVPRERLFAFLPKSVDIENDLDFEVTVDKASLEAPVMQGEVLGCVKVIYEGSVLGEAELITNAAVSKSLVLELSDFFSRVIKNPITIIAIILTVVGIGALVLYRSHNEALILREEYEERRRREARSNTEKTGENQNENSN